MSSQTVSSGITSSGVVVGSGDSLTVLSGGIALGTIVSSGGADVVLGETSGTMLQSFATETVSGGGVASATFVGSAAYQFVSAFGAAYDSVIGYGGEAYVLSAGLEQGAILQNGGLLVVSSGGDAIAGDIQSGGVMQVLGGVSSDDTIENGGALVVSSGGESIGDVVEEGGYLVLSSGGAASEAVVRSGGFLVVSAGAEAANAIVSSGGMEIISAGGVATGTELEAGGSIDLDDLAFDSGTQLSFNSGTDVLTVSAGGGTRTLQLSGSYQDLYFTASEASDGSTVITAEGTPCYCPGTMIAVENGEVPVETLQIGDRVRTASGALRPLRWIGRRAYDGRFAAGRRDILPVMVRASALADGVPHTDLFVSPLHALFLGGRLVPANALVNGISIVQAATVDQVSYLHLELETHDILLANGAPAESFVDDSSRGMFANSAEYDTLYPDATAQDACYCAPRLEAGEELDALRSALRERASRGGDTMPAASGAESTLQGSIDVADHERIRGWARDGHTGAQVRLRITDNGRTIGIVDAILPRPDLAQMGMGLGCFGFDFPVPGGLDPSIRHVIRVERTLGHDELGGSPAFVEPVAGGDVPGLFPILSSPGMAPPAIRGHLDQVGKGIVRGWAWNADRPDEPVAVQIFRDNRLLARVVANLYRPDLAKAEFGDGRHGFEIDLGLALAPTARHVVHAVVEATGQTLGNSPLVLEAASAFNDTLEDLVTGAVRAVGDTDQDRALSFMLEQVDRLRQRIADRDARREERERSRRLLRQDGEALRNEAALPRALIIDSALPCPDRDAGSNAVLSHARALQELGYAVSFVAADAFGTPSAELLSPLGLIGCSAPAYGSVEEVLHRQSGCFDVVYLHRISIAGRYLSLVRHAQPKARVLFSVADLHHLRLSRQARVENRPELLGLSHRLRLEECTAAWQADAVLTHSPAEADLLRQAVPAARVYEAPWACSPREAAPDFHARHGVLMLGNYAHQPNEDGARWLVEEVMPLVWREDPSIPCLLAGSDLGGRVRALGGDRVEILGHVADLGPCWDRVRLSVAPLRFGAGIKGKVVDSLAAGVPCVMSEIGAEGLALPRALAGLVGRDAQQIAALILRVHADADGFAALQAAGLEHVRARNNADLVRDSLRAAIEGRRAASPAVAVA
ncbi:Hint domain-containing protein [Acetobacteraceae bacterium KSS8]|uniref:Hint domain-containing protein n=1 Tax=Endosaccharibacter trunci TaxID=2812733 RepID=A0ABT1W978_9PROT|nr:Hint domain-containing protein [Acetobacteraceae bacterium KSS8]